MHAVAVQHLLGAHHEELAAVAGAAVEVVRRGTAETGTPKILASPSSTYSSNPGVAAIRITSGLAARLVLCEGRTS